MGGVGVEAELLDDGVSPGDDAARDVAGFEFGQHGGLQDDAGQGVGQLRLQPIADLDAHLVLAGRDDEQDAVVLTLVAYAPGPAELIAVVLDLPPLERRQGDNDELVAVLLLQRLQLGGQIGLNLGRQHVGVVHHPSGQGRKTRRRRQGGAEAEHHPSERQDDGPCAKGHAHWPGGVEDVGGADGVGAKLTLGAAWASVVAAKDCIGLAELYMVLAQRTPGKVRSSVLYCRTASL